MTFRRFAVLSTLLPFVLAAAAAVGGSDSTARFQEKTQRTLSAAHAASPGLANCAACHVSEGKIAPARCLACHKEIAREIVPGAVRGFHRDKGEDCAVCHAEHQGAGKSIVPLDIQDFDHAETGTVPEGAHARVRECARCHRPENSIPRTVTVSYIFRESGCRACHHTPHPGRQDDCLGCHNQNSWTVGRVPEGK